MIASRTAIGKPLTPKQTIKYERWSARDTRKLIFDSSKLEHIKKPDTVRADYLQSHGVLLQVKMSVEPSELAVRSFIHECGDPT